MIVHAVLHPVQAYEVEKDHHTASLSTEQQRQADALEVEAAPARVAT